ncbi:alpha/beta fold hydrolase [Aquirhabdus sp.]|uniref:alpha/beta fold hydrolase n=1 Tax=Aquirhabdus sp. TaxID=2824160 RepID=UPI00396C2FBD
MLTIPLRDGEQLQVRVIGHGATPVILLHGFGSQSAHWLPNVWPYTKDFQFILPDLRGFGHSHRTPLNQQDALLNYAQDIIDVLDHLGLEKVILAGISLGALIGLKMNQLGHFDRVSQYLHIDQPPQVRNVDGWQDGLFGCEQAAMFERFTQLLEQTKSIGLDTAYLDLPKTLRYEMITLFGDFFGYAVSRTSQRRMLKLAFRYGEPIIAGRLIPTARWASYMQIMNTYVNLDTDMRATLPEINIPMMQMVGMRSLMYPPQGQLVIQNLVPHIEVIRFDDAGHLPMLDQPLKFQREFRRFLYART